MLDSCRYVLLRDIEMLGPALPFRPNAHTIQGTAFIWYDAELQVDVWLRDNHRKARFYQPGQAHFLLEREQFAEFLDRGSRTESMRVWVETPVRSRTEYADDLEWMSGRTTIVNELGHTGWVVLPTGAVQRHGRLWPSDPLRRRSDQWPDMNHGAAASALLMPRPLFNGQSPIEDSVRAIDWYGRAAWEVSCVPAIDQTSPESVATDDVPYHELDGADRVEFVIDNERNIILEWRCIFEDQVYRRFWFENLTFDEPIDPDLFDIDAGPKPPPVPDNRPPHPPEVLLVDSTGTPLQQGDLGVWRWLVDGQLSESLNTPPTAYPLPVSVGAEAHFLIRSTAPQDCIAFFERNGDRRSSTTVHAAPVEAIVSGTKNIGRFEPSDDGTFMRLPCPAQSGTYIIKLTGTWPPPFNRAEPPHPDVPVYFATWIFAITTSGNPDFVESPRDSTMGIVAVTPLAASKPPTTDD